MKFKLKESNLLLERLEDFLNRFPNIPREQADRLLSIDPTYNPERDSKGEYSNWIFTLYNKGQDFSDALEIRDLLDIFNSMKRRLAPNERDIMRIKSVQDLMTFNNEHDEVQSKSDFQSKAELVEGVKFIYSNSDWEVYQPTTYEASKYLRGDNAVWCTGRHNDNSYWNRYSSKGNLYIFINKSNPDNKYLVFIENNKPKEFRDSLNESEDFYVFLLNNKLDKLVSMLGLEEDYKEHKLIIECKQQLIDFNKTHPVSNSALLNYKLFEDYLLECGMPLKVVDQYSYYLRSFAEDNLHNILITTDIDIDKCDIYTGYISNDIDIISVRMFKNLENMTDLYVPDSVMRIEPKAFIGCNPNLKIHINKRKISVSKDEMDYFRQHFVPWEDKQ